MRAAIKSNASCPCGADLAYGECCGVWHRNPEIHSAPTARDLMRSRYAAYVLELSDYLLATWHPDTRPAGVVCFEPGLRWLGLKILDYTLQDESHATVKFIALCKLAGRAHRMAETSRFVKETGRWFYVDGGVILGGE
ncbi:MAG: YchJ family protein [Burkholderiaceae bacterium]